ncbi:hypothetical protein CHLNCDRAFT_53363 [Chlorella variabilis]|uniref:Solute-binding protein family 3/N-terminal domain-containing protein n=1 Tax=Chlorella variabilis TaxID=554065 RepID=E1ZJJ2_CHLVA|nr:hypothetical protein CHLNCDRAFT_53363 [Chlorella variabilis]EFN54001.1 hypothetical protein CHLNCDRAFT_53363 [Chlorella variabilis]|eukprot:XP_005846103.1 hypothetical protein CHLNCDRAFT_53363 [Chlorella variabilis]
MAGTAAPWVLAVLLTAACAWPAAAEKVGLLGGFFPFAYTDELGALTGFDVAVAAEACAAANISCDFVPITNVADRIPSLQNGTVDILAAALVYTPEREALVQYVRPFYYASGTSLRALEANAAGLASRGGWEAIRGQPVCTVDGHYLNDYIQETYKPKLVVLPSEGAVVDALVAARQCVAAFTDSASLVFEQQARSRYNASVVAVPGEAPLDTQPYGLAVRQGEDELATRLAGALVGLLNEGNASVIYQLEQEFILANGGSPAPYLPTLTDALTYLVPQEEEEEAGA